MLFAEMLDEVQNSGQEVHFYEQMQNELKPITAKTPKWEYKIPILGKTMRAVEVLIDSNSIEEYKKTRAYKYVSDFDFSGDFFSGEFDLYPRKGYKKKVANVVMMLLRVLGGS